MDRAGKSTSQNPCLNIGIIGAGLAGLAAATGLARAGHNIEIFEKSEFSSEVGAAINVCPNAGRILSRWGFNFQRWQPCVAQETQVIDATTGKITVRVPYTDLKERFGHPYYLYHRVDLHNGLRELTLETRQGHPQTQLRLSSEVVDIDCENGILTLKDGSQITKDLLVVADGVHSRFVNLINGKSADAEATGMCSYRWLIPKSKLLENPESKEFVSKYCDGIRIAYASTHTRLVSYPCRSGELWNFNGIHPEKTGRLEVEDWDARGSTEDLVNTYRDFGPQILEVCKQAENLKLWKLMFRSPLDTWIRGKAVLIGDAAHPMLPHQGQGGAQGIEDGAALGIIFANVTSKDDIPRLLGLFQEVRHDRAAAIQCLSNVGYDEAGTVGKLLEQYIQGPVPKTFDEIHQFNYGHDVMLEAEAAVIKSGLRRESY